MLNKNGYEEIADIPETIADGIVINGEESFEEDSIVEVDLKDFEELGAVDTQSMQSSTIIDEFENKDTEKVAFRKDEKIITDKKSSINIQELSIQIDGLTTIKKYTDKVIPSKYVISSIKKEKEGYIRERPNREQYEEISSVRKEREQDEISEIKDLIKESIRQEFEKREQEENKDNFQEAILKQYKEIEKKYEDDIIGSGGVESTFDEINNIFNKKSPEDVIPQNLHESPENQQGNTFTIEIPDKFTGELPADFNIDELGKIDLREAETIAEEGLVSGYLLEELEKMDILPEQDKKPHIKNEIKTSDKLEQTKKVSGSEVKKKEKMENNEVKKAGIIDKKDVTDQEEKNAVHEVHNEPVEIESKEETIDKEDKSGTKNKSDKKNEKESIAIININPEIPKDNQPLQDNLNAGKKDENVLIIDNENIGAEYSSLHISVDELENISSNIVDVIEGEAKQLTESDTMDRKAVTGLIRDNYPTFKDLLKEKELEEQHVHFDDDIDFVDNSFIKKDQIQKQVKSQSPPEDKVQSKTPYEQMLGLIPDEIELIEDQLFKIKGRGISLVKAKNIYYDQHPEDSLALGKFKYILPVPDSLLDDEKKSIENEISAKSALIFEEDVDKIKKKLEDSMEKKIKETIQDITGKITIYEDNKKQNKTENISIEKEDIKRLLKYLNELLESLPEKSINKFANSDYYELYKKVFKDLDI